MRYRLVSTQNDGRPHVSSVVLFEDEVEEHLDAEATLHEMAGWLVERGDNWVIARRGETTRTISVRVSEPMDDSLEEEQ